MIEDKSQQEKSMPSPPQDVIDPERISAAQERWQVCPLRDCKSNTALLYEDFHLRDVRSNRVMCSKCAIHTEVGYMAREAAEGYEPDKPYDGKRVDYLLVFFTTLFMSVGINSLLIYMNFVIVALVIGIVGGLLIGQAARRLTLNRVGRFSGVIAIIGVIAGMVATPVNFFMLYASLAFIPPGESTLYLLGSLAWQMLPGLVATGLMAFTAFLVFLRR